MLVFCYGILLNKRVWQEHKELLLNPRFISRAYLKGYELIFDGQSKLRPGATCNIQEAVGKKVWGALFEVNELDLQVLDSYEGVPNLYQRKEVIVLDDHGNAHKAWVYFRNGQPIGKPNKFYLQEVVEGAMACGLPKEYIDILKSGL